MRRCGDTVSGKILGHSRVKQYMNLRLTYVVLLVGLAACSTDDIEPEARVENESALTETVGSVWAEYQPGAPSASIHAQFVRVQGISAEHALAALDVWRPDTELALDACSLREAPEFSASGDVDIKLLSAGPIAVSSDFGRVEILGRRLPDVDRVSGVVYGNEEGFDVASLQVPYEPGGIYRLMAAGGDVGKFDVSLVAPAVPTILTGSVSELEKHSQLGDAEFELTWETQADPGSELFMVVEAADGATMNCHLEDDGEFTVPGVLLEPFRTSGRGAELTLRRVSIIDAEVDGLERTRIVFGARDSLFLFW